jgi:hypothetical protein
MVHATLRMARIEHARMMASFRLLGHPGLTARGGTPYATHRCLPHDARSRAWIARLAHDEGPSCPHLLSSVGFTLVGAVMGTPLPGIPSRAGGQADAAPLGVEDLKAALVALVPPVPRIVTGPFLFAVGHCFPIKGQGSVLTGTVLQVRGDSAWKECTRWCSTLRNTRSAGPPW